MRKNPLHLVLGIVSLIIIVGSALVVGVLQPQKPVRAVASSDEWTTYLHDPGHSGFNSAETIINPSSAGSLNLLWTATAGSTISTQPVVANGMIYWGSWDGIEHATNLNGTQAWTADLGTATSSSCGGASLGIASSATVATVRIDGTPTSVVFVGGDTQLYALNASTGAIIWHTPIGPTPLQDTVIWSSPVFYHRSIYISTSSLGDCPVIQAQIFRLNAATGIIQNVFNVVPNGCTGAGVWGSSTIDKSNGTLYFATSASGPCSQAEIYADAIVQLNATNLAFMSSWQVPAAQQGTDLDFGSTPTLFRATIGGTVHQMVGVANKNGIYYALDEANISNGPVWTDTLAVGGQGPEDGDGSISPSAWDGTALYVGGGNTTIGGQSCQGGLRALNPATGAFIWERCMTDGPVIGGVTLVPGVVAVGEGTALWLMATSDGHDLFKQWDLSTDSKYYAGPTIDNGVVYIANKDGNLYAYGLPSSPPSPAPTLSP